MSNELSDIDALYSVVMSNLHELDKLDTSNSAYTQSNESIDEMIYIAENWYDNFKVVSQLHTSIEWRKDDSIIRERLQPLSQDARELLYKLDKEITESIKLEVHSLTTLAESIIERIWLLGLVILMFILSGYYYLRNRVLGPISSVANGLMIQSQKNQKVQLPVTNAREVDTLVNAFNHLSESLAHAEAVVRHTDKMSTVGELASCVAHEINNPLNNMARVTEFIEEEIKTDNVNDTVSDDFKILHREIGRCANIVKNLLDFGKPKEPQIKVVSLLPILDESIQLLKHKAQDKNLVLDKSISSDLPDVDADPSQIHQVFVNLILNAMEFSPKGETITVSLEQQNNEYIICRVIDRGIGADDTAIEHFFDPFYTTRKGHEGMGLGLSVCHGIIKHHQGDIGVIAGEHSGLIVWFTLPIAANPHINTHE
jgi:two-component system NtrC family sensor kinase